MEDFVVINPNSSFASRLNAKDDVRAYSPRFYDRSPRDLWEALDWGNADNVRRFIEKGAGPNDADKDGVTPLMVAAAKGSMDKVIALLDHGASIDAQDKRGKTALMAAVFNGRAETAMALLEKDANTNIQDNNGSTALVYAAFYANCHKESTNGDFNITKKGEHSGCEGAPCRRR